MDNPMLIAGIAALVGAAVGFFIRHYMLMQRIKNEEIQAGQIVNAAKESAREIELEAKNRAIDSKL
jgi:hypothetical protein